MKKGFKKKLAFVIIIIGVGYNIGHTSLGLEDINYKESKPDLYDEDNLVYKDNSTISTDIILVNKEYGLDKNYKPENLTIPNILFADGVSKEEKKVAGMIIKPLENLVNTAKKEGVRLLGNSAYRSYKSQSNIYNNRVESDGKKLADAYVAKPGFSEHQTGLSIDITNRDEYLVQGTKEADWLEENCYRFGFIIRYPYGKESITGIEYEPWHIRYVGEDAAKYIYDNGIALEEYLGK